MFHRLGRDQEGLIAALQASLADTYIRQEDLAQAGPLLARARDLLQRQPTEAAWLLARVDSVRGAYASKSGDFDAAERLLREAYVSMRDVHGAHLPYAKQALERLITFYDSVRRAEAANRYRQLPLQPPCVSQP